MKKAIVIGCALLFALVGTAWADGAGSKKTVTVKLQEKKANGKAWDAFGGGPDVAICVKTPKGKKCYPDGNDTMEILEPQCRDAFTCTFTDVYIEAPYEITVVDVDLAANDMAGTGPCDGKCTLGLAEVEVK